ncbi:MAG: hypothetical protein B6I17_01105 [Tenericutes bacterium 4572_104]|nr:MAG: hypothetical protein B6I17_01105 [Tenericutes bacterium 4572_104]
MIKTVIKSELKNIFRDKMNVFFVFFPIILGGILYYIIPIIEDSVPPGNPTPEIIIMIMILMIGYIFGAITAFTLLDDKDDGVLMSLKITPISVRFYIILKLIISYIFGVLATIILIYITNFLPNVNFIKIILISLLSALSGPLITLIVCSLARNKVEGFVIMKLTGVILILPTLVFFVFDWKEIFLLFSPESWPARLIQMEMLPMIEVNFSFGVYFVLGVVFNMFFLLLLFKLYIKKANI